MPDRTNVMEDFGDQGQAASACVHGELLGKSGCHPSHERFPLMWGNRLPMCTEIIAVNREVIILPDAKGIAHTAAAEFLVVAREAVQEKGSFSVVLAGGSTPKVLYELLSTNPLLQALVPWSKIHWFFGDERHVGPDDPESNFRMASDTMLGKAPVDPDKVHRIKGEKANAAEAAAEYEEELRSSLTLGGDELPCFDLVLLGMGTEGHTASLFPGTKALKEERRLVVSNWVGKLCTDRITLTPPVLNNAARVVFMVQGEEKAPALKAVLEGPYEPEQFPAQMIHPKRGRVMWLADPSAAAMLAPNGKRTL
jgi:6-phosphogluconolactonase